MSNRKIRNAPFWKLAVRSGIIFMIVVVIIRIIMTVFKEGNLNNVSKSLTDGSWVQSVLNLLIIGVVYGVTMTFIQKNNAKEK